MFKRILIAGGLGLVGLAGVAGTAGTVGAQSTDPRCYPVVTPACPAGLTISSNTATPGTQLTATATGLDPNTSATGTANSTPLALGTKTTSSAGAVSFTFAVPADFENGAHTVVVQGIKGGAATTLSVGFTVTGSQVGATTSTTRAGSGTIPRTGDDSSLPLTSVGIGLLAIGGGVVYVAKRRKDAAAV